MEGMKKQFLERKQLINEVDNIVKEYIADNSIQCNIAAGAAIDIRDNVIKKLPVIEALEVPETGIGDMSDGWHTFNELYHHRAILFSVICNKFPDRAWKSKKHHEGDMFEGMFIVGIDTPEGQATYHYDTNPYWDMFKVKELDSAPPWDGHSAEDAINRISSLSEVGVIDA